MDPGSATSNAAASERRRALERELGRIVNCLRETYDPEKVVLFGSLASGEIREWSDIDLLVIKATAERFLDRVRTVTLLVRPRLAVNFFIYTPEEYADLKARKDFFVCDEVEPKGRVLYEREPSVV